RIHSRRNKISGSVLARQRHCIVRQLHLNRFAETNFARRVSVHSTTPQINHFTRSEHDLQSSDVVACWSVFERARAGSVSCHIAADKTAALSWIRRIKQTLLVRGAL